VVFHPIWDQLGQSQSHHKKTRLRVTFGSIVLVIAQLGPELGGAWCMKGSPLANVHGKHQTPPKKKRTSFQFQYFGAIDLNSDPTDPSQPLLKATVKHRGRGTC